MKIHIPYRLKTSAIIIIRSTKMIWPRLKKVYHTSLMPSFKNTLTDEIENLVAFLYKSGN